MATNQPQTLETNDYISRTAPATEQSDDAQSEQHGDPKEEPAATATNLGSAQLISTSDAPHPTAGPSRVASILHCAEFDGPTDAPSPSSTSAEEADAASTSPLDSIAKADATTS